MRLEDAFDVAAPPAQVWAALTDIPTIVACMPGAELLETTGPNTWKSRLSVRLGPMAFVFDADLVVETMDAETGRAVMAATARETRGRGGATVRLESVVRPAVGGARVEVVTDVTISGPAGQFGRPVVQSVARRLTATFAERLEHRLQA